MPQPRQLPPAEPRVFYRVLDHCDESYYEIVLPFRIQTSGALEEAAVHCGQNYYSHHDGWEDKWPLTIAIHSAETPESEMGRCLVGMELREHFSATFQERSDPQ